MTLLSSLSFSFWSIQISKTKTIIIVTHNIKLLKNADTIYLLDKGKIVKKGKYEDFENNQLFKDLLNDKK